MRRATLAAPLVLTSVVLLGQAPFRAGVDIVRVDAVVVDKAGVPIRGLKATDFTVLEDGKPREIVSFDAIEMPSEGAAEPGEAAWLRSAPLDVVTNRIEDRRLFMILIDDAMLPVPDPPHVSIHPIERAKSIAREVVANLGPHDQAAIVFSMRSKKIQMFTSDRARLNAAIDATSFGQVATSAYGSAWTLANAIESLKTAPQSRKTLVLISPGVGLGVSEMAPVMSTTGGSGISGSETGRRVRDELNRLFADAARFNVNVYAYDALDFGDSPDIHSSQRDYLRTVAATTGGRAMIADEDPVEAITQMFRESSEYYLLGFSSASGSPGRHRLQIRTNRADAKVLSRDSFTIAAPAKQTPRVSPPLSLAMAGILPVDSLPMRVAAMALPGSTARDAVVAIALGINQPVGEAAEARERMTAQIEAYEAGGKFVSATKLDATLSLKPTPSGRAQYDLLGRLSLKPGRYQLRIAAHSPRLNLKGSVFADIDVPDFSRAPITVAPLVLSVSPSAPAAPSNAFLGLLPHAPTSHRSFAASDRVTILARVVEGGRKVGAEARVDVSVLDARNRKVFGRSESVTPVAGIVGASTDYQFDLPLSTLPAGDYLLTVKATTPEGVSERSLRFSRR